MGVQFGQPLCYEGEYSGRAFVGSSQSNAQEVKRRVFFKNIFMALDSKGPGCVNLMSPRVGKLSPTASIHPGV